MLYEVITSGLLLACKIGPGQADLLCGHSHHFSHFGRIAVVFPPVPEQVHLSEGELVEKFFLGLLGAVGIGRGRTPDDLIGYTQVFC